MDVGAGALLGIAPGHSEQVGKDVGLPIAFERKVEALEPVARGLSSFATLRPGTDRIVAFSLFGIGQNLEGLGDPLIAERRDVIARVDVRMVLAGELLKGAPDLRLRGGPVHPEEYVIVVPGHGLSAYFFSSSTISASITSPSSEEVLSLAPPAAAVSLACWYMNSARR